MIPADAISHNIALKRSKPVFMARAVGAYAQFIGMKC